MSCDDCAEEIDALHGEIANRDDEIDRLTARIHELEHPNPRIPAILRNVQIGDGNTQHNHL